VFGAFGRFRRVAWIDRAGPFVLFVRARVGLRVRGVVDGAAAEELEPRRQPVFDFQVAGRADFVVADRQRVDGLVFVDAAEDLPLRARLRLFDFDRGQFG